MAGRLLDRSETEIIAIESQFNKVHEFSQLEENPRIEPQPRRLNELGQLVQREQPQPQPQNEVEGSKFDIFFEPKFQRPKKPSNGFTFAEMRRLHEELNEVKARLNKMPLKIWHQHTKRQNPAAQVVPSVRKVAKRPELLTQAWCKITECFSKYKLVDFGKDSLKSVHLCEAPGAFISALNHHIRTKRGADFDWKWTANTLSPFFEGNSTDQMINDDRFIMQTLENWRFGSENTGDILHDGNRLSLVREMAAAIGLVDLVTADGSIDCQKDPGNQESIVAPLHSAEAALSLNLLAPGGHFVLKMFTLYTDDSIALLYLLRLAFNELYVFKPATSKEGNSEVYVIAKGFKDNLAPAEKKMLLLSASFEKVDVEKIPRDFIDDVIEAAGYFKNKQTEVILRNLNAFNEEDNWRIKVEEHKTNPDFINDVAAEWLERYEIKPMKREFRLCTSEIGRAADCTNLDPRAEIGNFENNKKDGVKTMDQIRQELRDFSKKVLLRPVEWYPTSVLKESAADALVIEFGKKMDRVNSTKFCPSSLLDNHRRACEMNNRRTERPARVPRPDGSCDSPSRDVDVKRQKLSDSPLTKRLKNENFETLSDLKDSSKTWRHIAKLNPGMDTETTRSCRLPLPSFDFCAPWSIEDITELIIPTLQTNLRDLRRGDDFILRDFPLLTRVSVGLLFVLAKDFGNVGFVRPEKDEEAALILCGFERENADILVNDLDYLQSAILKCGCAKLSDKSLHSILDVRNLVADPDLYQGIIEHNLFMVISATVSLFDEIGEC